MAFNIPYLPQTYHYLAQCTTKPSALFTYLLNNFIKQLIIDGNWQLLDRLWILANDTQQGARVSVVNPNSTQITEFNTPAWVKYQGYTGNGTSSYLNLNYNPAVNGANYQLNNASQGGVVNTNITTNANCCITGVDLNAYSAVIFNYGLSHFFGATNMATSYANVYTPTGYTTSGFYAESRTSYAYTNEFIYWGQGGIMKVNGYNDAGNDGNSTVIPNANAFALGLNYNNNSLLYAHTAQTAMVFWGGGGINQAKLYAAWNTFFTSL